MLFALVWSAITKNNLYLAIFTVKKLISLKNSHLKTDWERKNPKQYMNNIDVTCNLRTLVDKEIFSLSALICNN